jgi:hypothetical protein
MTLFTSRFKGCQLNENIDGVDVIREVNKSTVYKHAKKYLKAYKQHYEPIIDEINTRQISYSQVCQRKVSNGSNPSAST